MNLADYLSELLGQREEVNLPGLGYFVRERVNGYYDDKEEKFYPPYHHVKFVPEAKDDDTFAQYVAEKKNISLASSKYFAEKFVSKLKEDAAKGNYLFSDLGLFYTDDGQLVFKSNDKIASDPVFYGYPSININKAGKQPRPEPVQPVFEKQAPQQEVTVPPVKTLRQLQQEQYLEDEYEAKRSISIWWIILISVTIIAIALFAVYKFRPSVFDKLRAGYHKTFTKETAIIPKVHQVVKPDSLGPDTVIKAGAISDSTSKGVLPAGSGQGADTADTTNLARFEIIAASFRTLPSATRERDRYEAKGMKAKILTDAPGPLLKVSVGTYLTDADAEAATEILKRAGKIPQNSNVQKIKPHR